MLPDPYIEDRIKQEKELAEKNPDLAKYVHFPKEEYIALRQQVIQEVTKHFWKLEKLTLTGSQIIILTNDQGGHPFEALNMSINTGHSEMYIMEMFLRAVRMLEVSK